MSMKPDVQVDRVYAAEAEVIEAHGYGRDMSLVEIRQEVQRIVKSSWWKTRWPEIIKVEVTSGRGLKRAGASRTGPVGRLYFPLRSRIALNILHELSHVAANTDPHHSPEWARVYVEMTRRWLPTYGTSLSIALQRNKVQIARTGRVIELHDPVKVTKYQALLAQSLKLREALKVINARLRNTRTI